VIKKALLTGIQAGLMVVLLTSCASDQRSPVDIERKVDSLNRAVMDQLKKDSTNQSQD
jgi:hypothetical protein